MRLSSLNDVSSASYTYGDSANLHAATGIGSGSATYIASYGASGNVQRRAPDATTTCAGTPTGAQLAYDNAGHLSG